MKHNLLRYYDRVYEAVGKADKQFGEEAVTAYLEGLISARKRHSEFRDKLTRIKVLQEPVEGEGYASYKDYEESIS